MLIWNWATLFSVVFWRVTRVACTSIPFFLLPVSIEGYAIFCWSVYQVLKCLLWGWRSSLFFLLCWVIFLRIWISLSASIWDNHILFLNLLISCMKLNEWFLAVKHITFICIGFNLLLFRQGFLCLYP